VVLFSLEIVSAAPQMTADNPRTLVGQGSDQKAALKINDAISQAIGFGNTYLVTTSEGNVVIDTSLVTQAPRHIKLLKEVSNGPVRYIILTHGHGDHTGGVPLWKEAGTQIVAQKNHVEFMNYQKRLEGFFARRNAAQFALRIPQPGSWAGNYAARIEPTILFDEKYEFSLGGVEFQIMHTPGETPDHLTVWIPKYRAAFSGDNYYESFPNIYTLRGTEPRWALDYVSSLNRVMALEPELLLPSHGPVVRGKTEIAARLTKYRDAIEYVHDEVVKGMNQGKDVYTLMREVRLPAKLDVGDSYGKVAWSVRGIYEGYVGWFDMNPASMYEQAPDSVYPDLVRLAGGTASIVKLAGERVKEGRAVEALRLLDVVLGAEPANRAALEGRLSAIDSLVAACRNTNERGWLDASAAEIRRRLAGMGK
jgi:alkyl sulfatase BDS1-like metallo-beta-lactamase superfamily hydrolase